LSVLIPLLILALPLFDTLMVVLIRTKNRKPFWIGDHNHISHRFVKMGLSRKNAVIAVHLLSVVLSLGALPIYWGNFIIAAIMVVQAVLVLTVVTILQICAAEK
jgi:UDP-GlcNAc:undecaprenyl-phosphate GlcNAc-1-phosphate transferase